MLTCKSLLTFISLSVAVFTANSEKYHAAAFFELKGPVKEVIYTSADNGTTSTTKSETLKFDEEGALITDNKDAYTYDDAGYIVSSKANVNEPIQFTRKAIYNDEHVLTGYVSEMYDPVKMESIATNVFDDDGNIITTKTTAKVVEEKYKAIIPDGAMPDTTYTYSDIETDSHGNWIKRKVTITTDTPLPISCNDPLVSDYPETRTIIYY